MDRLFPGKEPDSVSQERQRAMPSKQRHVLQIKEVLQREDGRGTLKDRTETWFTEPTIVVCGRPAHRRLDGQREETDRERLETGY
jgi:hypothetical protein